MSNENQPTTRKEARKNRSKKVWIILLIVLLVLVLAAAGAGVWYHYIRDTGEYERYQFDTDAMVGRIQQMTEEEIQAELNRVVEEGMFNISIASAVVFDPETKEGQARIENIAANRYHMQVDIFLDETGEKVYSSKLIQPGYSIEYITLDKELEPGEYAATAIFSAITKDELELFGQAGAQIRLFITNEDGLVPVEPSAEPSVEPEATATAEP